jgi:integrase/recombinase XerD
MNLSKAATQFLSHCKHVKKLSDHTIKAYSIDLSEFLQFTGGRKHLKNCDRECLRNYVQYLFEEKSLKESSVKRRIATLKCMFGWHEAEETIEKNPFRILKLQIKLPKQLPKALTKSEIQALLKTPLIQLGISNRCAYQNCGIHSLINTRQDFVQLTTLIALELLFATGIRVGELSSINISDISLGDRTIRIKGKGNRERLVFLPDHHIVSLIKIYIQTRETFSPTTTTLLVNTRGSKLDTQSIRLLIRKTGEKAKLKRRITPHMLRHSAATHLLDSGVDIRYVQKLLGHQSITTTQIYTHVSDSKLKSIISKSHPIGKLLGGNYG